MSPNPETFLGHLRDQGYHSRSNKHSNALARAIAHDLATHCPAIRQRARVGGVVYDLNFTLRAGTADWNVDLVLGPPEIGAHDVSDTEAIVRRRPSTVQIAVEIKAVMTEPRKAIKNRKRDFEAHHEHVHNYNNQGIAGGVLLVNAASAFRSPLRAEPTRHRNPIRLVEHCLNEFRGVSSRGGPRGYGLEAKCAIVVDMDNTNLARTRFWTRSPAPDVGDPLHYDAFIQAICDHFARRFPSEDQRM